MASSNELRPLLELEAAYTLGDVAAEKAAEVAVDALLRGCETLALGELAMVRREDLGLEIRVILRRALAELGVSALSVSAARVILMRKCCRAILERVDTPYEVLQKAAGLGVGPRSDWDDFLLCVEEQDDWSCSRDGLIESIDEEARRFLRENPDT